MFVRMFVVCIKFCVLFSDLDFLGDVYWCLITSIILGSIAYF